MEKEVKVQQPTIEELQNRIIELESEQPTIEELYKQINELERELESAKSDAELYRELNDKNRDEVTALKFILQKVMVSYKGIDSSYLIQTLLK